MEQKTGKLRFHYAWVVLICCVLLSFGCASVVQSISGNYVKPIVTELGVPVSALTLFVSIEAAVMAFLYPYATKLLTTKKIGVVLALSTALQLAAIALMSVYRSIYLFYLSGVLLGIGASFTSFMAVPILVNLWFRKHVGLAMSIGAASSRLGGILWAMLSASMITSFGWRNSVLIMASVGAVVTIPALLLFVKKPDEMGKLPYGEGKVISGNPKVSQAATWGLTLREAAHKPMFYMVWLTTIIFSACAGIPGYMATFATMELGMSAAVGATAISVTQFGSVVCYLVLGVLNDRWGVRAGLLWGCSFMVGGLVVLLMSIHNPALLIPGCLLIGLGNGLYQVEAPLLVRGVLGGLHYASVWPVVMMGNSLIGGAMVYSSIGLFYDLTGTFRGAFITGAVLIGIAFVLGNAAAALSKKYVASPAAQE